VGDAVRTVFAGARPEEQNAGQRSGGASHVHDARAGKVSEAEIFAQVEHAEHVLAAPGPAAFHRIDDPGHDDREDQKGPKFHAFGHGAGYDRHGGGDEHDLEEEVRSAGVDRIAVEPVFRGSRQHLVEAEGFDAAQEPTAAVHDGVTAGQVHETGDGIERDVLGQDFGGVFGPHQAGLQHGEAGGHPHHQGATDKKVESVDGVLQLEDLVFHVQTPEIDSANRPGRAGP
jgi:hypothetical protein